MCWFTKRKYVPSVALLDTPDNAVIARNWIRCFNVHSQGQRLDQEPSDLRLEKLHPSLQRRSWPAEPYRLYSNQLGVLWYWYSVRYCNYQTSETFNCNISWLTFRLGCKSIFQLHVQHIGFTRSVRCSVFMLQNKSQWHHRQQGKKTCKTSRDDVNFLVGFSAMRLRRSERRICEYR